MPVPNPGPLKGRRKPRTTVTPPLAGPNPNRSFGPTMAASTGPAAYGTTPSVGGPAGGAIKGVPRVLGSAPPSPLDSAGIPRSGAGDRIRNDAEVAMTGANSDWHDSVFRAVMGLGDPNVMAKYRTDPAFAGYNFIQDPSSAFGQLDLAQTRGLHDILGSAAQNNTAMSGLRLNNENNLRTDVLNQKSDAGRSFEDALANYARALAAAQQQHDAGVSQGIQTDIDTQAALPPVPSAVPQTHGQQQASARDFARRQAKARKKKK